MLLAMVLLPFPNGSLLSAQAAEAPQMAPINPDFLEFWENPPERFYGYMPPPVDLSHLDEIPVQRAREFGTPPSSFDWGTADGGKVTQVKNQNPCGTCWAHGTLAAVESKVLIEESVGYDFSEQNVVCCTDPSWVYLHEDRCHAGGNSFMVVDALAKKGTRLESCDSYNTSMINTTTCNDSCQSIKRITGYRLVANSADMIAEVKDAIQNHGPVVMAYRHDNNYISGDIYYSPNCTLPTNHYVCIVGWDDGMAHPEGGGAGAWIVKNSWGTWWGDSGYFYLCYGSANMEQVGFFEYEDYDPNQQVYYWDEAGRVGSMGFGDSSAWMASIFSSQQDGELTDVEFWTTSNNAEYQIYVYLDGDISDGLQNLAAYQSGTCQEFGYYSIPLSTPVSLTNGQPFTVAVKMTTPGYNYPIPTESEISDRCEPPIQSGKCFIRHGDSGPWSDAASSGRNVCLRAVVSPAAEEPDITVTPPLEPFEVTLPPDTSENYTLTIANDGGDTLSYNISDRTAAGGGMAGVESLPQAGEAPVLEWDKTFGGVNDDWRAARFSRHRMVAI